MAHSVSFFQISGKNGKKLQSFYKSVFGWRMSVMPDAPMAMVDKEGDGIPGGVGASQNGTPNVTVYVTVDDVDKQLKKIGKAGGTTALQPTPLPNDMGTIAGFTDPEGNWVGIWQPVKPQAAPPKSAAPRRAPKKAAPKRKKK